MKLRIEIINKSFKDISKVEALAARKNRTPINISIKKMDVLFFSPTASTKCWIEQARAGLMQIFRQGYSFVRQAFCCLTYTHDKTCNRIYLEGKASTSLPNEY